MMLITDIASTIAASGPNSGTTALLGAGVVGVVASFCDRVDWLGSAVTSTVPVQPVSVTD
jgi:hypothetical protein